MSRDEREFVLKAGASTLHSVYLTHVRGSQPLNAGEEIVVVPKTALEVVEAEREKLRRERDYYKAKYEAELSVFGIGFMFGIAALVWVITR